MTIEGRVRSVLLLQPRNDDYGALVALFRQEDILGIAIREAGCLSTELQVPLSGSGAVVVTAIWESAAAYTGWRTNPARAQFSGEIERLTEAEAAPVQSGLYTIAIAAAAGGVD